MGKPEATVEDYLIKRVKETGGQYRKVKFLGYNGAADRLIWWRFPRVALVECKAPGKGVDPLSPQGREIIAMREANWPVFVVNSHEQVDVVIAGMTGVTGEAPRG